MRLSILIPFYNAEPYTSELLDILAPQITDDIEVIVIDDGSKVPFKTSYKWVQIVRQKNGGVSTARNKGLNLAKGDYIQFIDADDMVPEYFIEELFKKIDKEAPDVIEYSWKSLSTEGWQLNHVLRSNNERLPNPSVCTRCFKRSFIGDARLNELKDATEDEDFARKMGYLKGGSYKRSVISRYMYFYRTAVINSKFKRFKKGLMNTKRIVYYYSHVSKDMTWLLEEAKEADKLNEVWIMTYQNDIPELQRYCQITRPVKMWAHEVKGEPNNYVDIIKPPLKTQVVIYRSTINKVGGINTFILNFCQLMSEKYDITILVDNCDPQRHMQFAKNNRVVISKSTQIVCDTLIIMSVLDPIPQNVVYDKLIRTCHACKSVYVAKLPMACDEMVFVSEVAQKSFNTSDGIVIHNPYVLKEDKPLVLVSATRIPAPDKGTNVERMRKLAQMLNDADIPFVWFNFSDGKMPDPPKNFYNMDVTQHIEWFISMATYIVQLSNVESWSYSLIEALCNGKPVLCTPFESIKEIGIEDGKHGYIIPFDMKFDVHKILDVPEVSFTFDNEPIREQWEKLLGEPKPFKKYVPSKKVMVEVTYPYRDIEMGQDLKQGARVMMSEERAYYLEYEHPYHVVKRIGG